MLRWIVGLFSVICLAVLVYFLWPRPKPQDDCSFMTRSRTAGVDFQATVKKVDLVKGTLNLSTSDVRDLDQILKDYAVKYETTCRDFKASAMSSDEYNCRRRNMDAALDKVRLLSVTLDKAISAADKDVALKAFESLKDLAQADYKSGCGASIAVNPLHIIFGAGMPERTIRITNNGNRSTNYFVGELPEWFLPSPESGTVSPGETVTVAIVRTLLPVKNKVTGFSVRDNWNNQVEIDATVSEDSGNVYQTVAEALKLPENQNASLPQVLSQLEERDPSIKENPGRYIIASNVLATAGNLREATLAAQRAVAADPTLDTNPSAQVNLGVINTKAGAHEKADENFAAATKYSKNRPDFQATVRVIGTAAAIKKSGQTASGSTASVPAGTMTKTDAAANPGTVRFAEREFGLKQGALKRAAADKPQPQTQP